MMPGRLARQQPQTPNWGGGARNRCVHPEETADLWLEDLELELPHTLQFLNGKALLGSGAAAATQGRRNSASVAFSVSLTATPPKPRKPLPFQLPQPFGYLL